MNSKGNWSHKITWTGCEVFFFFLMHAKLLWWLGAVHQLASGLPAGHAVWLPWYLDGLLIDRQSYDEEWWVSIQKLVGATFLPYFSLLYGICHLSFYNLLFFKIIFIIYFYSHSNPMTLISCFFPLLFSSTYIVLMLILQCCSNQFCYLALYFRVILLSHWLRLWLSLCVCDEVERGSAVRWWHVKSLTLKKEGEVVAFPPRCGPLIDRGTIHLSHSFSPLSPLLSRSNCLYINSSFHPFLFTLILLFSPHIPSSHLAPSRATTPPSSQKCQNPCDATDHLFSEACMCCVVVVDI